MFDKHKMLTWEQEHGNNKIDFNLTKVYLGIFVKATDVYDQNTGGGSAQGNKYQPAQQMANIGNELRKWIQPIACTGTNKWAKNMQNTEKISSIEAVI